LSNSFPRPRPQPGRPELLLFVEDPSAVNYVALLLPEFESRGWSTLLCAANVASGLLRARGIDFLETDAATDARALIERNRPKCVLTGTAENPDTLGLQLIAAAREQGIASIAFVDARMNSEYRFRGRSGAPLAHAPDWLMVPDDWTFKAFASLGFAPERMAACGHPQHDLVRDLGQQWSRVGAPAFRRRIFPEVPPERQIVVFVSEGSVRYDIQPRASAAEFGLKGRGRDNGRTKIALEEVLDAIAATGEKPYFVFRAHPTENPGDYAEYGSEIDRISSDGSPLELVYASDLVIGMTSTLLLEAMLLGRPCLAVLPDAAECAWLPGTESGLVQYVTSREQLALALARSLQHHSSLSAGAGVPEITIGAVQLNADFIAARMQSGV
jgi:hypothetical protein